MGKVEGYILVDIPISREVGEELKLKLNNGKNIYYPTEKGMVESAYIQKNKKGS
jgi:hypothetical protein